MTRFHPGETVDEFLADLHWLGEPLPDWWMTCAFMSWMPQHVRQLLRASSQMDTMNVEQLLTRARAIMIDDGGCEVSAATSVGQPHLDTEVPSSIRYSGTVICYKCSGPNLMARNCTSRGVRKSTEIWPWTKVFNVIKLGTFHKSARETPKGRRRQHEPSSWSSEKLAIACCKSVHQQMRVHGSGGFWMFTDTGE